MRKIILRNITLLNFKGIRNMTIEFDEKSTDIRGYNGTGKTTIFDAFVWLLFGKDSKDRKDFNIKTLDANNQPIERIPHEVTACLLVNGEEIKLKKCYNEVWTKKRGSAVETFNGHSVECFYNDVPCSATEYNKKIAEICDEQVFKLITNPLYFTAQKKDTQRTMLFRMAGEVTTADIIESNPEFSDIVAMMGNKTVDELRREIQAKKRKIKDGIDTIPARIDERKRDMPEAQDWAKLEADIADMEHQLTDVNTQIADISKAYNEQTKQKQDIARLLSETKITITAKEYALKDSLLAEYNEAKREHDNSTRRVASISNERRCKVIESQRISQELSALKQRRELLLDEWKEIKGRELVFDEHVFVCPTCKRPLDDSDIEIQKEQMTIDFNASNAKMLEDNKANGLAVKASIEAKEKDLAAINDYISQLDNELARITASNIYREEPVMPDVTPIINSDREIISLRNKAADLQNQLDNEISAPSTAELNDKRFIIEENIRTTKMWLADRERIAANNKRIAELEKEYSESQCHLAELEGLEYQLQQFSKARIEQMEGRINGMFDIVRFKMFEQQINGGEIETCEATVDGVPFADLNSAMKINAGLDIINAFCKANEVQAPIFIDNREGVCELIPVGSQVINLIVDINCRTLRIE